MTAVGVITDIIDRPIQVDDFVVFYSNIYQVKALGKARPGCTEGRGQVKIMIWNGGASARPVTKYSKDIAVLDKNHVLMWKIKNGN